MIRGVDVSSVQPASQTASSVDWATLLKQGVRFAYVKSYEGNKGLDPCCRFHLAHARAAGLKVGVYTFLYPLDHIDPAANAGLHADTIEQIEAELGPLDLPEEADLEWPEPGPAWTKWKVSAPSCRAWSRAYLEALSMRRKRAPLVYTYPNFSSAANLAADPAFAAYGLSVADYPEAYRHTPPPDSACPKILAPWSDWTLWQHAGNRGMRLPNGADVDAYVTRDTTFASWVAPEVAP